MNALQLKEEKQQVRSSLRKNRREIVVERRLDAISKAMALLPFVSGKHRFILSYSSFNDEFCTLQINEYLAGMGKLLLPKVDQFGLRIFHVIDPEIQLEESNLGIDEPIAELCDEVDIKNVTLALIPGLGFDRRNQRIGYGKGFYDRFLCRLPRGAKAYGLGFQEQLISELLPTDDTDIALDGLMLF